MVVKYLKYTLLVICSVVLLAEVYYRLTKSHQTYLESIGGSYFSGYNSTLPSWCRIRPANDSFMPTNVDFEYPIVTNSWGMCEKEIKPKRDSVFRILITGDSYTEGVGAPYDSTWPRLLEKKLNQKGYNVEVINAGYAGSDVFYDYVCYRDSFTKLKPDLVIAALNSSDYIDYMIRGGLDRFCADGTTHYRKGPWYESVFQYSRFFRAVMYKYKNFPFSGIFVGEKEILNEYSYANVALDSTMRLYKTSALQHGANFVNIIHIVPHEIKYKESNLNIHALATFDSLAHSLNSQGVNCIYLTQPMVQSFGDSLNLYYHHVDGHYNSRGYNILAGLVADSLIANGMIRVQSYNKP